MVGVVTEVLHIYLNNMDEVAKIWKHMDDAKLQKYQKIRRCARL